jgi:hypothetical protein
MYELADWGTPVEPAELAQRERLTMSLEHTLVRVLRSRARAQGVTTDALLDRILHEALSMPGHRQHPRVITAVD